MSKESAAMGRLPWVCCLLIFALFVAVDTHKRVSDVMPSGSLRGAKNSQHIKGWAPDTNAWNEELYPCINHNHRRRRGNFSIQLTSDSPALIGSNITFTARVMFSRCPKEDDRGNVLYDRECDDAESLQSRSGYNWTSSLDDYGYSNCTGILCNVFPDGRPFPQHSDWRRHSFVYVWHTMGQYFQTTGGPVSSVSLNTSSFTLGTQLMEVLVYVKKEHRRNIPIANTTDLYAIVDFIPLFVNISQKNDRNASDYIFIKDANVLFTAVLHDPSHYLSNAVVLYQFNFGDNRTVNSLNSSFSHIYRLEGNVTVNVTVEAIIPVPCGPPTPTPVVPTSGSPSTTTDEPFTTTLPLSTASVTSSAPTTEPFLDGWISNCSIHRFGNFKADLTIVAGVVAVDSVQMTRMVEISTIPMTSVAVDFLVLCNGSVPTSVCTTIMDSTCASVKDITCDDVQSSDQCQLVVHRSFNQSGIFCVNFTLSDAASLALTSLFVDIQTENGSVPAAGYVLTAVPVLAVFAVVLYVLNKRYKRYKPVTEVPNVGLAVYFSQLKASFFSGNEENNPLLQTKPSSV
ncbi:protein QNR-71 [Erpetoichthys calabaricus]|uniref:protein QNR-71 n=1 Tax=Erpetoichthys calabaricus TaxID=27687 RepID=UPI002234CDD7|nr:protein QNR-71 [Erpetoichthys calabaricus]